MSENSNYKSWHKPGKFGSTKQGYYTVDNKNKYIGNPSQCIYRSSWEFSFMKYCDYSPSVLRWSAEPLSIPYVSKVAKLDECNKFGLDPNNPVNWQRRNYHVDFWIELDKGDNVIEKIFIEIKPSNKLKKPMPPKSNAPLKEQRRFILDAKEYLTNEAKFKAISTWAERNGCKFYVFTELTLQRLIGRFFNNDAK